MRYKVFTLLLLCVVAAFAQNQVVRRHGAKKETVATTSKEEKSNEKKSTPKNNSSASTNSKKTKNSTSPKQTKSKVHSIKASYSNGVLTVNGVQYEFVKVNAGTFTMGATSEMENPSDNEKPAHKVTLTNNYYMGKTEVTQVLWEAVMDSNPSYITGKNKPVENVSWRNCQAFILKLNIATGMNFRLPTEAEWEFAARGGNSSRHYQYSGSGHFAELVAWYSDNSGKTTHDVATASPNELGLYDMSGNVWEWCSDYYGTYYSYSQTNPTGPSYGSNRVRRGGCWSRIEGCCRSSYRGSNDPDHSDCYIGFRLALTE